MGPNEQSYAEDEAKRIETQRKYIEEVRNMPLEKRITALAGVFKVHPQFMKILMITIEEFESQI